MAMTEVQTDEAPKRGRRRRTEEPQVEQNGNGQRMSDEHKAALARGREHGRIVRNYLDALHAHKPKRGRKRTVESIEARLAYIEENFDSATALDKLHMAQEKIDLEAELEQADDAFDITELEEAFIAVAADYSYAKGLTYAAWRGVGVQPSVLKAAGITR